MVPDRKLSMLLSEVSRLPEKIDMSPDQHFVSEINSKGLHGILHVFSHDEALIVALLSLREHPFIRFSIDSRLGLWSENRIGQWRLPQLG